MNEYKGNSAEDMGWVTLGYVPKLVTVNLIFKNECFMESQPH